MESVAAPNEARHFVCPYLQTHSYFISSHSHMGYIGTATQVRCQVADLKLNASNWSLQTDFNYRLQARFRSNGSTKTYSSLNWRTIIQLSTTMELTLRKWYPPLDFPQFPCLNLFCLQVSPKSTHSYLMYFVAELQSYHYFRTPLQNLARRICYFLVTALL